MTGRTSSATFSWPRVRCQGFQGVGVLGFGVLRIKRFRSSWFRARGFGNVGSRVSKGFGCGGSGAQDPASGLKTPGRI